MNYGSDGEAKLQADISPRERVVHLTKQTGVLPCIKLRHKDDYLAYARAMYEGGARVIEITMTTPDALSAIAAIAESFGDDLYVAAGTVLDPATAREVILAGGRLIVSPVVLPDVIAMAHRYQVACYSGAFTPTECLTAMQAGAEMIKIFPAQLGGPKYMTNLRMVFPEVNPIPSGGITEDNAGEYIRCGACAISGARTFMNHDKIAQEGLSWITAQVALYIGIVQAARAQRSPLP